MSKKIFPAFAERSRDKVWFSLLINIICLTFMLLVMAPAYETNDDTAIRLFINGAVTNADPHLVYQNYILGVIYKLLYSMPGSISWYTVFQYAVLLFSFTAVTYVVLRKWKGAGAFYVVSVLQSFFAFEAYISVQYTKTAGIAMCAGVFLMFYAVGAGGRTNWKAFLSGLLLGSVGSMFRFRQAAACAALMTGIGVFAMLKLLRRDRGNFIRGFWPYIRAFGTFLLCILVLEGVNRFTYAKDGRWAAFMEFNELRTQLLDYGFPDFCSNEEIYEGLGIDETAYNMYKGWNINDPDKLTVEAMRRLVALKAPNRLSLALVRNFLKEFPLKYFQEWTFYGFLLFGVLWLFYGCHRMEGILAALYQILLFGAVYLYLYLGGRYSVHRVDVGFWFAMSLTAVWLIDTDKFRISWHSAGIAGLSILLLCQNAWKSSWRAYHTNDTLYRASMREVYDSISKDKEHLYISKIGVVSSYSAFGVFDEMPAGIADNLCWLGGWDCNTPTEMDIMAAYGVQNPFRDIVGNPRVYLIDDNIKETMKYIHKHYAPGAKAVKKKKINGKKCYQIV